MGASVDSVVMIWIPPAPAPGVRVRPARRCAVDRPVDRHGQVHLGAFARCAAQPHGAAVPLHPAVHRVGQAVAVAGHGVRVEADAAVAHEHVHLLRLHLDVDAHLAHLRVLGSVDHRLPGGEHERAQPVVERPVADHDRTHVDRVGVLDLRGCGGDRAGQALVERRVAGRPPGAAVAGGAVQPVAQLALLAAGEPQHLARLVGLALDERQRLQHRVVQVGGDLRALGLDDALAALLAQLAHQPHPPRDGEHTDAEQRGQHRQHPELHLGEVQVPQQEHPDPGGDEQRTGQHPPQRGAATARTPVTPERAPAVQRLRCDSSASRHTTAAPTAATPSGPTIQPTTVLPSAAAARPAPMPSAASPRACWRSARPSGRGTSVGSWRTKIHSSP